MAPVYCISGFGADKRIFKHLDFGQHEVHYIPWKTPEKKEKLDHYAQRLASGIKHEKPVLLGVSFGGMVGVEISRLIPLRKLILISSVKTRDELPLYMRIAGNTRLNKVIPLKPYSFLAAIENYQLGVRNDEEKELATTYRKNIDPVFSDWGINEILNWRNDQYPTNLFHIHGDDDHIFPIKNIKADYVVKGGGHLMLMDKAPEISNVLQTVLTEAPGFS